MRKVVGFAPPSSTFRARTRTTALGSKPFWWNLLVQPSTTTSRTQITSTTTSRFTSSVTPGTPIPKSLNSTQQPAASTTSPPLVLDDKVVVDTTTKTKLDTTTTASSSYLDSLNVFDRLCDLQTPEGRCVGLQLRDLDLEEEEGHHPDSLDIENIANNSSHWIHSLLHPQEVAYGLQQASNARRETFFIGRIAVREALGVLQGPTTNNNTTGSSSSTTGGGIPAILRDEHGRPTMPKGYLGSISHKGSTGVGIVSRDETYSSPDDPPKVGIGIDLERTINERRNIARRVLTEDEIASLGRVDGVTEEEEVMLRFSLKECIYKSVHPLICQYVGFQEAEVTPLSDGTATVSWKLKSGADLRLGKITAHWQRLEGGAYFLSTSSAVLVDDDDDNVEEVVVDENKGRIP